MHAYIHTYVHACIHTREGDWEERGLGGWGGWEQREGEHTRETRKRGRRRKGRGQCRRTEPEALKLCRNLFKPQPASSTHGWLLARRCCKNRPPTCSNLIMILKRELAVQMCIFSRRYQVPYSLARNPPPMPPVLFRNACARQLSKERRAGTREKAAGCLGLS